MPTLRFFMEILFVCILKIVCTWLNQTCWLECSSESRMDIIWFCKKANDHLINDESFEYITVVQARFLKMWFGISKFSRRQTTWSCQLDSCCQLRKLWKRRHACHPIHSSKLTGEERRVIGMWLAKCNDLHHLWCHNPCCFFLYDNCICKLCNCDNPHMRHMSPWLEGRINDSDMLNPPFWLNLLKYCTPFEAMWDMSHFVFRAHYYE